MAEYKEQQFEINGLIIPLPSQYSHLFMSTINDRIQSRNGEDTFCCKTNFDLVLHFQLIASLPVHIQSIFADSINSVSINADLVDDDNYTNQFVKTFERGDDQHGPNTSERFLNTGVDFDPGGDQNGDSMHDDIRNSNIFAAVPVSSHYKLVTCSKPDSGHEQIMEEYPLLFQHNFSHLDQPETDQIINNNHFSYSHIPNTIYPYDTAILPYQQMLGCHSDACCVDNNFNNNEKRPEYNIPALHEQVSTFRIDLVRIVESITAALNYIDVQNVCVDVSSDSYLDTVLNKILIIIRNTIFGLAINAPYLYYSPQIPNLPQISLQVNNLCGSFACRNGPNPLKSLINTSSTRNSYLNYPIDGVSPPRDSLRIDNNAESLPPICLSFHTERNQWGMVIIVYENIVEDDQQVQKMETPHYDEQVEQIEQTEQQGAKLGAISEINNDLLSNLTMCEYGCQLDPAALTTSDNTQGSQFGVYLLCIRPYRMIPPHYHTILDEVELNLTSSVCRESSVLMVRGQHQSDDPNNEKNENKACHGSNDPPSSPNESRSGLLYGFNRSTWGISNHWSDFVDDEESNIRQQDQTHQKHLDQNFTSSSPRSSIRRENHVHTYNNYTPFWSTVYCMSRPSFIPGDEIILGTPAHKEYLHKSNKSTQSERNHYRNLIDSLGFEDNITNDEKLQLHPLCPSTPWLGDQVWGDCFGVDNTSKSDPSTPETSPTCAKIDQTDVQTHRRVFKFPGCFEDLNQRITFLPIFPEDQGIFDVPALPFQQLESTPRDQRQESTLQYFEGNKCADAVLAFTIVIGEDHNSHEYQSLLNILSSNMQHGEVCLKKSDRPQCNHQDSTNLRNAQNYHPLLLFTQHKSRGVELPGGKVDPEDYIGNPAQTVRGVETRAVLREVKEETGLDLMGEFKARNRTHCCGGGDRNCQDDPIHVPQNDSNFDYIDSFYGPNGQPFIIPFARYVIDESVTNEDAHDAIHHRHVKDIFIIVLSYQDVGIVRNDDRIVAGCGSRYSSQLKNEPSPQIFECGDPFFRPILDIIPSLDFINCNSINVRRNKSSSNTHNFTCNRTDHQDRLQYHPNNPGSFSTLIKNEKLSPLLQEQVFTLSLRRLQGLINQIE